MQSAFFFSLRVVWLLGRIAPRVMLRVEIMARDTGNGFDMNQPPQRDPSDHEPFGDGLLSQRPAGTLAQPAGQFFL